MLPACVSTYQISSVSTSSANPSARSADGFDFPVGPPNAIGYSKSRGFRSGGHLGEDWITDGGSSKGFRSPVYAIGNGVVVLARDIHADWGNVVIVRHAWIENRQLRFTDSLYGHLDQIVVREGQQVRRGQQVGMIGTNHGMYPPHLHFEMHKDLSIGVNHAQGTRDLRSYWVPSDFITAHRHLSGGIAMVPVPQSSFLLPTPEHPWGFHRFFSRGKKSSHTKSYQHSSKKPASSDQSGTSHTHHSSSSTESKSSKSSGSKSHKHKKQTESLG
jgi:murein DD-endopeptidase MepM/ murein hydrolase activator NlpD